MVQAGERLAPFFQYGGIGHLWSFGQCRLETQILLPEVVEQFALIECFIFEEVGEGAVPEREHHLETRQL